MKIAVIADGSMKEELLAQGLGENASIEWLSGISLVAGAECYIDLLFDGTSERLDKLAQRSPAFIIVNELVKTLPELPGVLARINGWPGFLKRTLVEVSSPPGRSREDAEKIFAVFNKTTEWVNDIPGLISARVISMIINEAYHALEENVSTKQEIDTAMKLGTNYPYGPFEWSEKIGLEKVYHLLHVMAKQNARYEPSALLKKEAIPS
ncbi:MAG: 3-hydroxyacyl-CoA dehydrogenase family protein [Chitinophagaceae bacterium]